MVWKFKQELARKFIHLFSVLILVIFWYVSKQYNKQTALLVLVFILLIFLILEYVRIEKSGNILIMRTIWAYVRRKKEKNRIGGEVFMLVGSIMALALFEIHIAFAVILMTTFGDLAAALIGKRFGRNWISGMDDRAWEGILAEFFVNTLIGIVIFFTAILPNTLTINAPQIWTIIFTMSLIATFVETIIYKMDDNLVIPLFAGFAGQMIYLLSQI